MDHIENVKKSYGRCLSKGDVPGRFYEIFLANPKIGPMFAKTDFSKQKALLRHGINLMILFANGDTAGKVGVERIRRTHSKHNINIPPALYTIWKASLLQTISEMDEQFTDTLKEEWSEVLQKGIDYIKDGYDAY